MYIFNCMSQAHRLTTYNSPRPTGPVATVYIHPPRRCLMFSLGDIQQKSLPPYCRLGAASVRIPVTAH